MKIGMNNLQDILLNINSGFSCILHSLPVAPPTIRAVREYRPKLKSP
jgi:hypothetical protein